MDRQSTTEAFLILANHTLLKHRFGHFANSSRRQLSGRLVRIATPWH
jgi:hypothetical protein